MEHIIIKLLMFICHILVFGTSVRTNLDWQKLQFEVKKEVEALK